MEGNNPDPTQSLFTPSFHKIGFLPFGPPRPARFVLGPARTSTTSTPTYSCLIHHETFSRQTHSAKTPRTASRTAFAAIIIVPVDSPGPPHETPPGAQVLGRRVRQGGIQGPQEHGQPAPHRWFLDTVAGLLAEHRRRQLERGQVDSAGVGEDVTRAGGPALRVDAGDQAAWGIWVS